MDSIEEDSDDETKETYICPYCMEITNLDVLGEYCPACDEEVVMG